MPLIRRRPDRGLTVRAYQARVGGLAVQRYDLITGGPLWLGVNEGIATWALLMYLGHDRVSARHRLMNARHEMIRREREGVGLRD